MEHMTNRKVLMAIPMVVLAGVLLVGAAIFEGSPVKAGSFPPLTGAEANLPPAKAALLQQQVAEATGATRASKSESTPIVNQPGSLPPGGIQNIAQGPFNYSVFAVLNSWGGSVNGQWLWVYAGQSGPANQMASPYGGVALFSQPLSGLVDGTGVKSLGFVTVPGLNSPLKITEVTGAQMTLSDSQGNVYTFDLSNFSFAKA